MARNVRAAEDPNMSMYKSVVAIVQSARSIEVSRVTREQTERAILASLKLLRQPVFPDDRGARREQ